MEPGQQENEFADDMRGWAANQKISGKTVDILIKDASNVKCTCIIQTKAVSLIYNADRLAHTNELFKELYILKFPEFVQYKTAILMFHIFHGTLPIHMQNRLRSTVYSTTRSRAALLSRLIHLLWFNCSSKNEHKSDVLSNSLSNDLSDCNRVIIFKKNPKTYFISIY